jgi:hypothetical protein
MKVKRTLLGQIGAVSNLIAQAFALIGHSILPAGGAASDPETRQHSLLPADFERAARFAIVWPASVRDEQT